MADIDCTFYSARFTKINYSIKKKTSMVSSDLAGKTILLVEQNAKMSLHIASRGYVLETGRIVLSGTGKELTGNPKVKEAYLGG